MRQSRHRVQFLTIPAFLNPFLSCPNATALLSYRTLASIQWYQRYQADIRGIMVTKAKSRYVLSNSNN